MTRLVVLFLIALLSVPVFQTDAAPALDSSDHTVIPFESGEVVFNHDGRGPGHVYIIGTSHRDTFTRANGGDTLRSQMELYRISEWLIQNRGLELLLPEGFFLKDDADGKNTLIKTPAPENSERVSYDSKTLEQKLGEDNVYTNAEMLLMESYKIRSQQIEDMDLYSAVREKVSLLEEHRDAVYEYLFIKSGLDYLQEIRTAAMLQKIPGIIEGEYREGRIKNKRAIFSIGMSHLSGIIKYLKQNRIEIHSPAFTQYDDYHSNVTLLEKEYGVTIIIPRTLADNRDLIKLTRLDDIRLQVLP